MRQRQWLAGQVTGAQLAEAFGVLVFALVGVGWSNLSGYSAMRSAATRRRVITASMMIVLLVSAGWVTLTSLGLFPRRS